MFYVTLFNSIGQHWFHPGGRFNKSCAAHGPPSTPGVIYRQAPGLSPAQTPAPSDSVPTELTCHTHTRSPVNQSLLRGTPHQPLLPALGSFPLLQSWRNCLGSLTSHQDCTSRAGSTPGAHGHQPHRSKESPRAGSCCPCTGGTRAVPSQCLTMNCWLYLGRPLEALECQLPLWRGVESLLK